MTLRLIKFALIAALATTAQAGTAAILDFEGLSGAISNQIPGVSISATGGINQAWVYDTTTAGADPDLTAPFSEIGGGADINPGNVLIVQENSGGDPDDNAGGGTISLAFDNAITLTSIDVFDMKLNSYIQLFSDDAFSIQIGSNILLGDADTNGPPNMYEHVVFGADAIGVKGLRITMLGSGAIDNVSFVPIPAAAWLFGSALLGLGMVKRRKA